MKMKPITRLNAYSLLRLSCVILACGAQDTSLPISRFFHSSGARSSQKPCLARSFQSRLSSSPRLRPSRRGRDRSHRRGDRHIVGMRWEEICLCAEPSHRSSPSSALSSCFVPRWPVRPAGHPDIGGTLVRYGQYAGRLSPSGRLAIAGPLSPARRLAHACWLAALSLAC
jgi:hypothetical protein